MSETLLVKQIQLALAPMGVKLFRNNVGRYKAGKYWIQYGLCVGSSDLVGVWQGRAVFIEVKAPRGVLTHEQENFLQAMKDAGAIAFVARSVEEAVARFTL